MLGPQCGGKAGNREAVMMDGFDKFIDHNREFPAGTGSSDQNCRAL